MSDVKDALPALCEYVNSLVDVRLTPEHLQLAKANTPDKAAAEVLWSTLRILSRHAVKEKQANVDFRNYDASSAVKLHLAFLQYPTIEFYCLSQDSEHNRDALIALAWLLGTQNVLTFILRAKLSDSVLGTECSPADASESPLLNDVSKDRPLSTSAEFDNILHLNATVNLNLREIDELVCERAKLVSKAHMASLNASGLPHLSVSELALTKRFAKARVFNDSGSENCEKDQRLLREFREVGILLDKRTKWLQKRHIFFDWMATVIQEHKRCMESNSRVICVRELAAFCSLLRHVIRDRLRIVTSEETMDGNGSRNPALNCSSRTRRSQCNSAEAQRWSDDLNERQTREEDNLQQNKKQVANELKEMLKLIPSIVHV
ncbi:hypothetical protein PUN28_004199 [Cardiocondyla obscurior]|uniref:Tubulin epsilon and delta complex protein 1 domain-containing protein n=1 Tax=Cardiocondyla obscurior TaxID=286306 RepID=A0AAW2GQ01_9HYME